MLHRLWGPKGSRASGHKGTVEEAPSRSKRNSKGDQLFLCISIVIGTSMSICISACTITVTCIFVFIFNFLFGSAPPRGAAHELYIICIKLASIRNPVLSQYGTYLGPIWDPCVTIWCPFAFLVALIGSTWGHHVSPIVVCETHTFIENTCIRNKMMP